MDGLSADLVIVDEISGARGLWQIHETPPSAHARYLCLSPVACDGCGTPLYRTRRFGPIEASTGEEHVCTF
jgi:hypothetical protein